MRIPNRKIPTPTEEPKQEIAVVERIVEAKSDHAVILAEVKRVMTENKAPTKWIFSVIRDANGDMEQVVASAVDAGTII